MAVWTDKVTGDVVAASDPNTLAAGFGAAYDFTVDATVDDLLDYHAVDGSHTLQIDTGDIVDYAATDDKIGGTSIAGAQCLYCSAEAAENADPTDLEFVYTNTGGAGVVSRMRLYIRPSTGPFRVLCTGQAYRDASVENAHVRVLLTRGDGGETKTGDSPNLVDAWAVTTAYADADTDPEWLSYMTQVDIQLVWDGADVGKVAHLQRAYVTLRYI